jgi:hypothetical protein
MALNLKSRLALLSLFLHFSTVAQASAGNLLGNPGLELSDPLQWRGSSAVVQCVTTRPHSGKSCLYVRDASDSHGQGNSFPVDVQPGHYYAEAWLRVDPKSPGIITFDVQFFDRDGSYFASSWLGVADSTEWTLVRGRVTVPERAVTASLRLLPTGRTRGFSGDVAPLHGNCFADDFYFATLREAIQGGRARPSEFPVETSFNPVDYASAAPMRPHLLITARKVEGLLSVAELRESVTAGHREVLWQALKKRADADLLAPPIVAGTDANYIVCNNAVQRIRRTALAFLITGDSRYKNAAVEQIEITFDSTQWPEFWRDDPGQPKNLPAGLRVGQLCAGIGIAYDWLYTGLTPQERNRIVAGLDRQGIQPFIQTVKQGNWQVNVLDNFMPAIVGSVGLAGMSLAEDHPASAFLVQTACQRMKAYLSVFGPEGEWNESVGYADSMYNAVRFYSALRYWTTTRPDVTNQNPLAAHPFPQFCRWKMYMTLPHGREAKFGNCSIQEKVNLPFVPAVATAAHDGVLQWFYLNHRFQPEQTFNTRDYVTELLTYDPALEPKHPEGRLPHGHAFAANTMCVSSRTTWDPVATPCVVYGKGGAAYEIHGHHDLGQVCIDGYGDRLIVDQVGYDGGYDGGSDDVYSAAGHNVLVFNGKDMIRDRPISRACFHQPEIRNWPALRSHWVAREFDDRRGGYWILDTTDVYEDVEQVRRTVVHLNPEVVVVLDTAMLSKPGNISLRWHTVDKCDPHADGSFLVRGRKNTQLVSRVVPLDTARLALNRGEHAESTGNYVEASLRGHHCSILSLFCVIGPGQKSDVWRGSGSKWSIQAPSGMVDVSISDKELKVTRRDGDHGWQIPCSFPSDEVNQSE